jgi:8-oxo-dGTP pyrophosphatase MutT (NUDIX family)/ketosteroid isomerase-like protein
MTSPRRAFSVATFARHRGRVLLIRHARLQTWLPVGGEVEAGETPLEAARRELLEETGLRGRYEPVAPLCDVVGTPAGLIGFEEHLAGSKGLHMNFCFVADVDTDAVVANEEFGEHRWVAASELDAVDGPPNVRQLAAIALAATSDESLRSLARAWLAAFNERALDRLLALYADDAVHTSPKLRARRPETRGEVRGKAALRAWWSDSFERLPGLHYEERAITTDAARGRLVLEYERTLPSEDPLAVAELFVVRDGMIVESRVFHG